MRRMLRDRATTAVERNCPMSTPLMSRWAGSAPTGGLRLSHGCQPAVGAMPLDLRDHRLRHVAQGVHHAGAAAEETHEPCRTAIRRRAGGCHLLEVMACVERFAST